MITGYVGAALFLCGALVLTAQRLTDAGYGGSSPPRCAAPSPSGSSTINGSAVEVPLAEEATGAHLIKTRSVTPTRSGALVPIVVVAALAAAVGILERWWLIAPGYAVALLLALPVLAALTVVDVRVHRLPNRLTRAMAALTLGGLVFASIIAAQGVSLVMSSMATPTSHGVFDASSDPWAAARRAVIGAVVLGLGYLLLALLGGGQGMGLGDVKLAPSLGALLAWPGWSVWCLGAMGAFVLGGLWGVGLMLRGRGRSARMPFGPFMMVAALLAIVFA